MILSFHFKVDPIHIYVHNEQSSEGLAQILRQILKVEKLIMATKEEVLADLGAIATTVTKIGTETSASLAKIAELEALIAAGSGLDEIAAKVAEIKAGITAVDDLVTDAPTPPTP